MSGYSGPWCARRPLRPRRGAPSLLVLDVLGAKPNLPAVGVGSKVWSTPRQLPLVFVFHLSKELVRWRRSEGAGLPLAVAIIHLGSGPHPLTGYEVFCGGAFPPLCCLLIDDPCSRLADRQVHGWFRTRISRHELLDLANRRVSVFAQGMRISLPGFGDRGCAECRGFAPVWPSAFRICGRPRFVCETAGVGSHSSRPQFPIANLQKMLSHQRHCIARRVCESRVLYEPRSITMEDWYSHHWGSFFSWPFWLGCEGSEAWAVRRRQVVRAIPDSPAATTV